MGYMYDIAESFRKVLAEGDDEATIRFFKEKLLESYRNGLAVARAEDEAKPRPRGGKAPQRRGARQGKER